MLTDRVLRYRRARWSREHEQALEAHPPTWMVTYKKRKTDQEQLGERWRGGLVVTRGGAVEAVDPALRIWAVPVHRLLTSTG